ncbi:MAG: tRNA uridine-5-carboxymethylaminomethyl(34) synthesis enzyme MnmG [Prevotella sp.]|nr:tRNA uridine-5-carboxymethylaminomethyl(34) synthesis enzyme MnmG [Bacteroides sp.]MCM1366256.1 tRNA uridine-5-carboxymethylaminomethyl(34) synthesis enzyme MnmG [Prevotella sp.]MCM1436339.1 tRNA uridine-5-carboxymethylaminomethyl(34) synthesis enzyme MnmG [Prevotella sp.]
MKFDYDVIVVGGGHAGCEAAAACARLGVETLLVTGDMNRIAQLSCNPAIGGIAKGQIVREIDALGGMTGIVTDLSSIQFRMLNRSKGPAVWSPRAQVDRTRFIDTWRQVLDSIPNLMIYQDFVSELLIDKSKENDKQAVTGVKTAMGIEFTSKCVVLTVGTFLNGKMHFGEYKTEGGRISEGASYGLTEQLQALGFRTGRMKTGTPARIDGRSIDYSLVESQPGDDVVQRIPLDDAEYSELPFLHKDEKIVVKRDAHKFSYLPEVQRTLVPRDCYIVHTNLEVHKVLNDNLDRSPLYNGDIKSIGPRYCPSIETKIVTFADKESHQLFLEPEGETTQEFYINGFSSSMPPEVQFNALTLIPALRNLHFYRPGYAIEYDFFDPTQLTADLHTKPVDNLYFAGQINGTTGYEEAAGQGLIAGINAARKVLGKTAFTLQRDQAYIGVLIDDLITKGVDEPYRMFTSRAEYRILLRQDDADMRLTQIGYELGLATKHRYDLMVEKRTLRDSLIEWCTTHTIKATEEVNKALEEFGTAQLTVSMKVADLLKRPQLNFEKLSKIWYPLKKYLNSIDSNQAVDVIEAAEILIKYDGYIKREKEMAEKMHRLEEVKIPTSFDYMNIKALSTEARQKLTSIRPATIGMASRISGVSPADVSVLLLMMGR